MSKGQIVNILGFAGHTVFFAALLNSAIAAQKPPSTIHKWAGLAWYNKIVFIVTDDGP